MIEKIRKLLSGQFYFFRNHKYKGAAFAASLRVRVSLKSYNISDIRYLLKSFNKMNTHELWSGSEATTKMNSTEDGGSIMKGDFIYKLR